MAKQQWQKPLLVVLVRSNPEEGVLTACKTYVNGGDGAAQTASGCWYNFDGPSSCGNCAAVPSS